MTHPSPTTPSKADEIWNEFTRTNNDGIAIFAFPKALSAIRQLERELAAVRSETVPTAHGSAAVTPDPLRIVSAELPPIPTKRTNEDRSDWYGSGYVDGWNACVDRLRNATDRTTTAK